MGITKTNSFFLILISFLCFTQNTALLAQDAPNTPRSETEAVTSTNSLVQLRALDKITARISKIELRTGSEKKFGSLIIKARYCRSRPPQETPESYAYLEIDDITTKGERTRVFDGWMLASSPGVSALEHAVYDVWVIGCKTVAPVETEPKT